MSTGKDAGEFKLKELFDWANAREIARPQISVITATVVMIFFDFGTIDILLFVFRDTVQL